MGEKGALEDGFLAYRLCDFILILYITALYISLMCWVEWQHFCVQIAVPN
jgi:hypothetical protein